MSTTILNCNCKSEFQDKTYGEGKRVFNDCNKGFRCVVCGALKGNNSAQDKKKLGKK